MAVTLEERKRQLLKDLGLSEWPTLLEDLEALTEQALQCLKTESGYQLVSPPKGKHKKWQARTSGAGIGQRSLGYFSSAEQAAKAVFHWVVGITPTPPTPSRIKERNPRNSGKRKLDRCSHGKGVPSQPLSSHSFLTVLSFFRRWSGLAHERLPAEKCQAGDRDQLRLRGAFGAQPAHVRHLLARVGRGAGRDGAA